MWREERKFEFVEIIVAVDLSRRTSEFNALKSSPQRHGYRNPAFGRKIHPNRVMLQSVDQPQLEKYPFHYFEMK